MKFCKNFRLKSKDLDKKELNRRDPLKTKFLF
jgi:hypothetical protein